MKIAVAPPLQPLTSARADTRVEAPPEPHAPDDPLAFARVLRFGAGSEIDEAAVALVDLSVLVYKPLETIRRVFARLGVTPAVLDPWQDRAPDLIWLGKQAFARRGAAAFAKLVGKDKPVTGPAILSLDGMVNLLRVQVDSLIIVEPYGQVGESQSLREARERLAETIRANLILVPASDDDIGRDFRNRPPRVLALRHGDNVYIAFRGSSVWADFKRDGMAWPAERRPWRHEGFELCWKEIQPHVENWLAGETRALGHRPTLHLGGHSLGGGIASIAAIDLADRGYEIARVVTLGCPRVGGRAFRAQYASTSAAADAGGMKRNLADVTTRFVHGTDLVATLLPPAGIAVHVIPQEEALTASDRLTVEEFVGKGLFDTSAMMDLLLGATPTPAYMAGLAPSVPITREQQWRNVTTQVATWIAMALPQRWWARALPLLPAVFSQGKVSVCHHFSARYWAFFPPTAVRLATAVVLEEARAHPPTRADGLHVVTPT